MMGLKKTRYFLVGLTFSLLASAIAWYWYKATSAEEGALDLLDRLAATDARLRQLQAEVVPAENGALPYIRLESNGKAQPGAMPEDLQQVKGVGPVFAERLYAAGIVTLAALAALTPAQLVEVLGVAEWRAEAILQEARLLSG